MLRLLFNPIVSHIKLKYLKKNRSPKLAVTLKKTVAFLAKSLLLNF